MEEIIAPVDRELLKSELTAERRLRSTNKSHNEIYIVNWKNAPNVLKEIGRLREIAFRAAGGGTGKALDLDEYDLMENPYQQLIVWNPDAEEILGGYRYILGDEVEFDKEGKPVLATAHMFNFQKISEGISSYYHRIRTLVCNIGISVYPGGIERAFCSR